MITECIECKRSMKIIAKGLCSTCYKKSIQVIAECKNCHKLRYIRGKNYCASCAETIRIKSSSEKTNKVRSYHKLYRLKPENIAKEKIRNAKRRSDPKYIDKIAYNNFLNRLSKYGITEDFYTKECEKGCQICKSKERLHIDHDHSTKKFRGILCGKCNQGIGLLNENIDTLQKAIIYLQNNNKQC